MPPDPTIAGFSDGVIEIDHETRTMRRRDCIAVDSIRRITQQDNFVIINDGSDARLDLKFSDQAPAAIFFGTIRQVVRNFKSNPLPKYR